MSSRCLTLSAKIRELLKQGIDLKEDVTDYINSTFSNPSVKELHGILHDPSNPEKDSVGCPFFS